MVKCLKCNSEVAPWEFITHNIYVCSCGGTNAFQITSSNKITAMPVKIKKLHPDAVVPQYSKSGDAGMDLTATHVWLEDSSIISYGTGLAFEIPAGYVGLIFPRSSVNRTTLDLSNAVGVVDSGYRGEVTLKFRRLATSRGDDILYSVGERIGQIIIMPYPQIQFEVVEELTDSERGTGGYGSSGK